ncbi:MAG: hypothetical protein KH415_11280 [Clostridium sp.]|nr:hypothetical protein [Clostridium sp.]
MDIYTLTENGILEIADVVSMCFRWIGWQLIKLLAYIVNGIEKVVNSIYTLNDFFNSVEINNLINKYKPLIWVLLAISIGLLGFKIMYNRKQNRGELPSNILFAILVVALLPTLMIKLNDMTKLAVESVNISNTTLTNQLIKKNIYDLYYLDKNNFDISGSKNGLPEDRVLEINENEVVDSSNIKNKSIFENKVVIKSNGDRSTEKLEKGWLTFDEDYYRYSIKFSAILVSLASMGIALVCVSLKVVRLIIELAVNKLFATLLAFTDIDDGKRLKEVVKHIISIFVVIFATAIMIKIYLLFNTWIENAMVNNGLGDNQVLKMIFLIGGAITVIDGPNIIERILGIDVGLKSAWGAVMAGYGVGKGAINLGQMAIQGAGKLGGGLALGMASATGMAKAKFDNIMGNKASKNEEGNSMAKDILDNREGKDDNNNLNNYTTPKNENDNDKEINNGKNKDNISGNSTNNDDSLSREEMNRNIGENNNNNPGENDKDDVLSREDLNNNIRNTNRDSTLNDSEGDKKNSTLSREDLSKGMRSSNNNPTSKDSLNSGEGDKKNSTLSREDLSKGMRNSNNNLTSKDSLNSGEGDKKNSTLSREDLSKGMRNPNNNSTLKEGLNSSESGKKNSTLVGEGLSNGTNNIKTSLGGELNSREDVKKDKNSNNLGGNTTKKATNNDEVSHINSNGNKNEGVKDSNNLNKVSGKLEERTIGEFTKDKFINSKPVDNLKRAYNLGYNTGNKWDLRKKGKKNKRSDN